MATEPVLEIRGVRAHGAAPLDLNVERGEAVALVSAGGTGKRWLLRVAAGLREASPGTVRCSAAPTAYVFSTGGLVANMSALDNIVVPLRFSGLSPRAANTTAGDVLAGLGLAEVAHLRPASLADEARQLVQWARAMALKAELLYLEEPFRLLSPSTAGELASWLCGELASGRVSVLMSCTDAHECARIGARLVPLAGAD